ncbi:MAG: type II secretion system protein [Planctomycetota bacterium]|nr:MAG: type II secretion system protein [Planctomycetota bacterium]
MSKRQNHDIQLAAATGRHHREPCHARRWRAGRSHRQPLQGASPIVRPNSFTGRRTSAVVRGGYTLLEVLASLTLLSVATVLVGTAGPRLRSNLEQEELHRRIGWAQGNLQQQVLGWDPATISEQRIATITPDNGLDRFIADARWNAEVQRIDQPVRALQVTVALTGQYRGQSIRSRSFTFWIELPGDRGEP